MKDFIGFIEEIEFIGSGSGPAPEENLLMKDDGTSEVLKDDNTSNLIKG